MGNFAPGGYKYGSLAFEVGGWATGRKPIILKKIVRKPKVWPGNGSGKGLTFKNRASYI